MPSTNISKHKNKGLSIGLGLLSASLPFAYGFAYGFGLFAAIPFIGTFAPATAIAGVISAAAFFTVKLFADKFLPEMVEKNEEFSKNENNKAPKKTSVSVEPHKNIRLENKQQHSKHKSINFFTDFWNSHVSGSNFLRFKSSLSMAKSWLNKYDVQRQIDEIDFDISYLLLPINAEQGMKVIVLQSLFLKDASQKNKKQPSNVTHYDDEYKGHKLISDDNYSPEPRKPIVEETYPKEKKFGNLILSSHGSAKRSLSQPRF